MARIVGFQGLPGAYSELAILQYFGKKAALRFKPLPAFETVFTELTKGRITDALLPVENSLAGTIHENFDHLARFPVQIAGEAILRIQHCLLIPPGTRAADVTTVISHPQALAQCAHYLRERGLTPQNFFDTAGAAEHLGQHKPPHTAAIASLQAAKLYGLKVMARDIADRGENYTRFLHIQKSTKKPDKKPLKVGRMMSLILLHSGEGFARIGPLCGILQSLGIELVHCEARPTKDAAWTYFYFLEVAAGPGHPAWDLALKTLASMTRTLKVLGSYASQR
ncbi:prephenate dehydratase [Oligoflexus tunisiensis]|uniref:prephenate dehydratase n=1 Tax=Oligoflexus tunisiensis TaxID=708132 RepID=UPI000A9EA052|nr:prephenate dehydratase domain-containing protein [Oligoflexus tunisiensis]